MPTSKVSICIATYNMGHLIEETVKSCQMQTYKNTEIIIYDDASTDGTEKLGLQKQTNIQYFKSKINHGVGNAFNKAIAKANGEFIILMCADDLFTDIHYIEDVVRIFKLKKEVGYVTRFYHQFIGDNRLPVRAWRGDDPIVLANNPSGLSFRKKAIENTKAKASNKMFIETSYLASKVCSKWKYHIIPYDAIAVRVHDSTSTKKEYYLKRRVSSPVKDWVSVGGKEILKDYCSLIQIKCNFTMKALCEEILNFITMRPINILMPHFWFYVVLTIVTPRPILRAIPHIYRKYIGRYITKEVKRCNQ